MVVREASSFGETKVKGDGGLERGGTNEYPGPE